MSSSCFCARPAVVALTLRCDGPRAHVQEAEVCGQHYVSIVCDTQTREVKCGGCRPAQRPLRIAGERRLA